MDELSQSVAAMELNDILLKQLECPVCLDTFKPPIMMCKNGHNVCSTCVSTLLTCPICRLQGTPENRNIVLEGLCELVLIPCKHRQAGCMALIKSQDLEAHYRDSCQFTYKCLTCEWSGTKDKLLDHARRALKHSLILADNLRDTYEVRCLSRINTILQYYQGEYFWILCEFDANKDVFRFHAQCSRRLPTNQQFSWKLVIKSLRSNLTCNRLVLSLDDDFRIHNETIELSRKMLMRTSPGDRFVPFQFSFRIIEGTFDPIN